MKIEITHFLDEDGSPLVTVPLTNTDAEVILYEADFNSLYQSGLDPRWRLSMGQVIERGRDRVSVARLVANARKGDKIQYLDRNPCNLKRDNLVTDVTADTDVTLISGWLEKIRNAALALSNEDRDTETENKPLIDSVLAWWLWGGCKISELPEFQSQIASFHFRNISLSY